jgi:predicted HD phosphohydrolase
MGLRFGVDLPGVAASVDDLLRALRAADRVRTDEGPTLLHHLLSCAEVLAHAFPEDETLQVAGLVHDLGLVLRSEDLDDHARNGAYFVGIILGARVAEIVAEHDDAARYLATADAARDAVASHRSAVLGLGMDPDEVDRFRASRWWRDAVILRRADELSLGGSGRVRSVMDWLPAIERVSKAAGYLD